MPRSTFLGGGAPLCGALGALEENKKIVPECLLREKRLEENKKIEPMYL
jgi:hypothetical protein